MSDSGRMPRSTRGQKRWPVSVSSWRSSLTSPTTRWWDFVRHICVSVATINSRWWRSRLSSTIQPSRRHSTIHHFGPTRCTSVCRTDATATCKHARHEVTPYGRWLWMSWIDAKIQAPMHTFPAVLWLTRAPTFSLVCVFILKVVLSFKMTPSLDAATLKTF